MTRRFQRPALALNLLLVAGISMASCQSGTATHPGDGTVSGNGGVSGKQNASGGASAVDGGIAGVTAAGGAAGESGAPTTSGASGMSASAGSAGEGGISGDGGAPGDDAFTEGIELTDPVKASEADTSLSGTDNDKNGVRDDLDAYIATLETDPRKQTVLVSFARESTAMMLLGGTPSTARAAALAQAQRVGRTIDCLHDLYAGQLSTKQIIVQNVRNALYDNAQRLRAYNHASTLLSGSIFHGGNGCDSSITGVAQ